MFPCDNDKTLLKIDLFKGEEYQWYRPEISLHDYTTANGPKEQRFGVLVSNEIEHDFFIDMEPLDGCVKLSGLWQTSSATAAYQSSIRINECELHAGLLHLPVVCAGWPSVYLNIPAGCLRKGSNRISFSSEGPGLLLSQLSLFIRPDSGRSFDLLYAPRVIKTDRQFCITILLYKPVADIKITSQGPIEFIPGQKDYSPGEADLFFHPTGAAGDCSVIVECAGEKLSIALPPVLDVPTGLPCYVGTDSDDHSHDDNHLMDDIISHLCRSETGNMVMFRPKEGRNCITSPSAPLCRRWIDLCRKYDARYFVCDWPRFGQFPAPMEPEMAADTRFLGYHVHEPYFVMHDVSSSPDFKSATDYRTAHDALINMLKDVVSGYHARGGKVSAGEASWFVPYDGEAGFDIINAEAVTSIGPIFGAVRGTLRGRPHMSFGHHTAIEWYLGFPHNDLKSKRAWLLMLLAFAYGASYIYAENSLFFTNTSIRNDPEDKFTSDNRAHMQQLYDVTRLQPRFGEPCAELAVAYGNLESILWYHDDILPEMLDGSTWMENAWNKWKGDTYKPAWRALDAWLVPVEIEQYYGNESILKWFSGNPYGNVDVVSTDRDSGILSMYKVLAFLGWNTMTEEVLEKLKAYVSSGGVLFISGCQFDRRTMSIGEYDISTAGAESLLGLSVTGSGEIGGGVTWNGREYPRAEGVRLCSLDIHGAEVQAYDDEGNPMLLRNRYGDGEVYFCNYWDHPTAPESVELMKSFMAYLGGKCRSSFGLDNGFGISCTHWYDTESGLRRLYLVNVNWQKPHESKACLIRLWGRPFPITMGDHDLTIVTEKDGVAVVMDNPLVSVNDISVDSSECRITITGNGNYTMRLFCSDQSIRIVPQGALDSMANYDICVVSGYVRGTSELRMKLLS